MTMGSGSRIDSDAIIDSVHIFETRLDECVQRTRYRNSNGGPYDEVPISVREARLTVAPGILQRGGYFDIQWWCNGDYKYHYEEDGLQFRFGREEDNQGTDDPVEHFHPPADPGQHRQSCIASGHPPELVTLAVIANWVPAARRNDPDLLNDRSNPP